MEKYENLALSESGFLFDAANGSTYTLNRTGTLVLRAIMAGSGEETIVDDIVARFDIAEETARRDITQFTRQLAELHVIAGGEGQ